MANKSNPNIRKQPERRCLGCMQSFPKKELIRLVRTPESAVELDFIGKKSGRGAYICRSIECFKKARKAGRFQRNLECEIPEDVYNRLEVELSENR